MRGIKVCECRILRNAYRINTGVVRVLNIGLTDFRVLLIVFSTNKEQFSTYDTFSFLKSAVPVSRAHLKEIPAGVLIQASLYDWTKIFASIQSSVDLSDLV